jgi:hypothetical protein
VTHPRHSHARSFHHNRAGHLSCVLEGVCRSHFQTTDFPVAFSNVDLHYPFAHLKFNIKCNEYFDAAKISYLGWYEWNGLWGTEDDND